MDDFTRCPIHTIVAVDPGTTMSALVVWDIKKQAIVEMRLETNYNIRAHLHSLRPKTKIKSKGQLLLIEEIQSYGQPVGKTVFDTCIWCGRFIEAYGLEYRLVTRTKVKSILCHSVRAKDTNVRGALIEAFGEPGTKKNPGKLHGVKKDLWAALALAVAYQREYLKIV